MKSPFISNVLNSFLYFLCIAMSMINFSYAAEDPKKEITLTQTIQSLEYQKESLIKQLSDIRQKNLYLLDEVATLKSQLEEKTLSDKTFLASKEQPLREKIETLEQSIIILEKGLKERNQDLFDVQEENQSLLNMIDAIEKKIETANAKIKFYEKKLEEKQGYIDTSADDLAESKATIKKLKSALVTLSQEKDSLQKEFENKLEEQKESLADQMNKKEKELTRLLTQSKEDLEKTRSAFAEEIKLNNNRIDTLNEELNKARQLNIDNQRQKNILINDNETYSQTVNSLQLKLDDLKASNEAKLNDEQSLFKTKINQIEDQIKNQKTAFLEQIKNKDHELQKARQAVLQKQTDIKTLKTRLSDNTKQKENTEQEYQSVRLLLKKKQAEFNEQLAQANNSAKLDIKKLENKISALSIQNEQGQKQIKNLLDEQRELNDQLSKQKQSAENIRTTLTKKINRLNAQIDDSNIKKESAFEKNQEYQKIIKQLQKDLEHNNSEINKLNKDLAASDQERERVEELISQKEKEFQAAQIAMSEKDSVINEIMIQKDIIKASRQDLKQENLELLQNIKELTSRLKTTEQSIQPKIEKALMPYKEKNINLNETVEKYKNQIKQKEDVISHLSKENKNLLNELKQANDATSMMDNKMLSYKKDMIIMKSAFEQERQETQNSFEKKIERLSRELKTKQEQIDKQGATLLAATQKADKLTEQLNTTKNEKSALEQKIKDQQVLVNDQNTNHKKKIKTIEVSWQHNVEGLEARIKDLSNTNKDMALKQEKLLSRLDQLTGDNETKSSEIDRLTSKNNSLNKDGINLTKKIGILNQELETSKSQQEINKQRISELVDLQAQTVQSFDSLQREKKSLEEELSASKIKSEKTISRLQDELAQMNKMHKRQTDQQSAAITNLQEERDQLNQQLASQRIKQKELLTQQRQYQKEMDQFKADQVSWQEQVENLKTTYDRKIEDIQKLFVSQQKDLRDQLEAKDQKQRDLLTELTRLEKEKNTIAEQLSANQKEHDVSLQKIDVLTREKHEVRTRLTNENQKMRDALTKQIDSLKIKTERADADKNKLLKEKSDLREQIEKLSRQLASVQQEAAEKDLVVSKLTDQMSSKEQSYARQIEQSKSIFLQEINTLQDKFKKIDEDRSRLQKQLKELEDKNASYQAQIAKDKDARANRVKTIDALKQELQNSTKQHAAEQEGLRQDLSKEIETLKTTIKDLRDEKSTWQSKYADLKTTFDQALKENNSKIEKLSRSNEDLSDSNQKLVSANQNLLDINSTLKGYETKLKEKEEDFQRLSSEYNQIAESLKVLKQDKAMRLRELEEAQKNIKTIKLSIPSQISEVETPLKAKIKVLTEETERLRLTLAKENEKSVSLERDKNHLTAQWLETQKDNDQLKETIESLNKEINESGEKYDKDLKSALSPLQDKIKKLNDEKQNLSDEIIKQKEQFSQRIKIQEKKLSEQFNEENKALSQNFNKQKNDLTERFNKREQDLLAEIKNEKEIAAGLKNDQVSLKKELGQKNAETQKAIKTINSLREELAQSDTLRDKRLAEVERDLQEKIKLLTQSNQETQQRLFKKENALAAKINEFDSVREALADKQKTIDRLSKNLTELKQQASEQENLITQKVRDTKTPLLKTINDLNDQLNSLSATSTSEINDATEKIKRLEAINSSLKDENTGLKLSATETKKDLGVLTAQNKQWQDINIKLEEKISALTDDLNKKEPVIQEDIAHVRTSLEASVRFLEKKLLKAEENINQKEAKLFSLSLEQKKLKRKLFALTERINNMTKTLSEAPFCKSNKNGEPELNSVCSQILDDLSATVNLINLSP